MPGPARGCFCGAATSLAIVARARLARAAGAVSHRAGVSRTCKFDRPTSIEEIPGAGRLLVTEMRRQDFQLSQRRGRDPGRSGRRFAAVAAEGIWPVAACRCSMPSSHPEFHRQPLSVRLLRPSGRWRPHARLAVHARRRFAAARRARQRASRHHLALRRAQRRLPGVRHRRLSVYFHRRRLGPESARRPDHRPGCHRFARRHPANRRRSPDGQTGLLRSGGQSVRRNCRVPAPRSGPMGCAIRGSSASIRQSANVFAADNGWESWEMVHRIVRGGNCGWPVMEGRAALRSEVKPGPTPIVPPVKDHPHTEANSVIGGPVYRGSKLPGSRRLVRLWRLHHRHDLGHSARQGQFLFAHDARRYRSADRRLHRRTRRRTVRARLRLHRADLRAAAVRLERYLGHFPAAAQRDGLVRVARRRCSPRRASCRTPCAVDRWMDGAKAERWVAIPGDGRIQLSSGADAPAVYPEGTVFVKHLTLPQGEGRDAIRLETQLLHYEHGTWHPYSYLWDDAGRDALAGRFDRRQPTAASCRYGGRRRRDRTHLARQRHQRVQAVPQRRSAVRARLLR